MAHGGARAATPSRSGRRPTARQVEKARRQLETVAVRLEKARAESRSSGGELRSSMRRVESARKSVLRLERQLTGSREKLTLATSESERIEAEKSRNELAVLDLEAEQAKLKASLEELERRRS